MTERFTFKIRRIWAIKTTTTRTLFDLLAPFSADMLIIWQPTGPSWLSLVVYRVESGGGFNEGWLTMSNPRGTILDSVWPQSDPLLHREVDARQLERSDKRPYHPSFRVPSMDGINLFSFVLVSGGVGRLCVLYVDMGAKDLYKDLSSNTRFLAFFFLFTCRCAGLWSCRPNRRASMLYRVVSP